MPGHGRGQTENVLHVLLGRDGGAGRDATDQRNRRAFLLHVGDGYLDANDLFRRGRGVGDPELGTRPIGQVQRTGQAGLANQVPVGFKRIKVVLDR